MISNFPWINLDRPGYYLLVGGVTSPDAGLLMAVSLDLLLGEVHFLLSLLDLTQGPRSPHLQALVAVLKARMQQFSNDSLSNVFKLIDYRLQAFEAQSEYIAKLKARAEQMQEHMVDSVERCGEYSTCRRKAAHFSICLF